RFGQLVGDPDPGQHLFFVFARCLLRVDDGQRRRHLRPDGVVIGDDHVQPGLFTVFDLLQRADAAVYRDHQLEAAPRQLAQRFGVQAVAFVHPVRNVVLDVCAKRFQDTDQQRRAGHAVRIEIAVDDHWLTFADRLPNPAYGLGHAAHLKRLARRRLPQQKTLCSVRVGVAPVIQDLSDDGMEALKTRSLVGRQRWTNLPSFGFEGHRDACRDQCLLNLSQFSMARPGSQQFTVTVTTYCTTLLHYAHQEVGQRTFAFHAQVYSIALQQAIRVHSEILVEPRLLNRVERRDEGIRQPLVRNPRDDVTVIGKALKGFINVGARHLGNLAEAAHRTRQADLVVIQIDVFRGEAGSPGLCRE